LTGEKNSNAVFDRVQERYGSPNLEHFKFWSIEEIFGCNPLSMISQPEMEDLEVDDAAQTYIAASQQDVVRVAHATPDGNCFFQLSTVNHARVRKTRPMSRNYNLFQLMCSKWLSSISMLLFGSEAMNLELRVWTTVVGCTLPLEWWRTHSSGCEVKSTTTAMMVFPIHFD